MTYRIALSFEDGVTRFIDCAADEKVLDAAFRQQINLPMDCSDGVCGTCKCRSEAGRYELGDDYLDSALSADEAAQGYVLTCQMRPRSDGVIRVPARASSARTGATGFQATLRRITEHADAVIEVELETAEAPLFLPGQYVNIGIPQSSQTRSYSFSSRPGERLISFLIKRVPDGAMATYLARAQPGDVLAMTGPLGSFYLRDIQRPLLMLAGGTGLAPFLAMLETLAAGPTVTQPIRLYYGVTRDQDLVLVERLEAFARVLPDFRFVTVVAQAESSHPRRGYVTDHLAPEDLHDGQIDVYLCGPPPMVDGVRRHFSERGLQPAAFHYEKFTPNAP